MCAPCRPDASDACRTSPQYGCSRDIQSFVSTPQYTPSSVFNVHAGAIYVSCTDSLQFRNSCGLYYICMQSKILPFRAMEAIHSGT